MNETVTPPPAGGASGRAAGLLGLLGVFVLGAALVGFVSGTRAPEAPPPAPPKAAEEPDVQVPRYKALREGRRGPNQPMYPANFGELATAVQKLQGEPKRDLAAAVVARGKRRAFEGAPPVIPHAVGQMTVPACLACHENGAVVDGRVARAMSHKPEESCVQCHVAMADPRPPGAKGSPSLSLANSFARFQPPAEGARAWKGAPPVIPHEVRMRDNCLACHGPAGEPGLRVSHPERQNCLQCHAGGGHP